MLYPIETLWELNVLFHEFPYNLNMNGVEVGVYFFLKNAVLGLGLGLLLTLTLTLTLNNPKLTLTEP